MSNFLERTPVLWVEDWPLLSFFFQTYVEKDELDNPNSKMELLWVFIQKMLLAKEAEEKGIFIENDILSKEYEKLLAEPYFHEALSDDMILEEDLLFFVKVEYLYNSFLNELKKEYENDIKKNPKILKDLYEKNEDLMLKNAYELLEVWSIDELDCSKDNYSETDFIEEGARVLPMGILSENEILNLFPEEKYPILGKKPGSLIEIDLSGEEKLYYYIKDFYETYKKDYEDVKDEFENFIFSYVMEDTIEELNQKLMDKYEIKYNEEQLNKLLSN